MGGQADRRGGWRSGIAAGLTGTIAAAATLLAVGTAPEPVTLHGSVLIHAMTTDGDLPDGFACTGRGPLADIVPGLSVIVADEDHVLLGKGRLSTSVTGGPGICVFGFVVEDLPGGHESYRVRISHRGEIVLGPDELVGPVDLRITG